MPIIQEKMNGRDKQVKEMIIDMLINEGYGTYAKRLKEFEFIVADFYGGTYIPVAAMFPQLGCIVINTGFLDDEETFKQLSVIVRHELLHFLLMHEKRLYDHLKATDPDFEESYKKASIHEIANYAMDWELSERGYDDHDKDVVRNMTLNGRVCAGLILSDQHPEWLGKPMEEIFELQKKEYEKAKKEAEEMLKNQPKTKINIHKATHSPEYIKMYNDIIKKYNKDTISEDELNDLLDQIEKMSDEDLDKLI